MSSLLPHVAHPAVLSALAWCAFTWLMRCGLGIGVQADREKRRREEEEQQRRMDELAARQRAREEEIEKRLREEKAAALSQPPIRAEPPVERREERASRPAPSGGEFRGGGRPLQLALAALHFP